MADRFQVERVRAEEIREGDEILVANLGGTKFLSRGVNAVREYVPEAGGGLTLDLGDRWVRFEPGEDVWRVVPSSTEPDGLFGEALTENGTILRLKLARAMYEAEVRNKKIGAGWTDEEVLDAYWDQLDAICPILLGVTKGGSQ